AQANLAVTRSRRQAAGRGGTEGGAGLAGVAALARAVLCADHVVVGLPRSSGGVAEAGSGNAAGCAADGGVGAAADRGPLDVVAAGAERRVPAQAHRAIAPAGGGGQAGGRIGNGRLRGRRDFVAVPA